MIIYKWTRLDRSHHPTASPINTKSPPRSASPALSLYIYHPHAPKINISSPSSSSSSFSIFLCIALHCHESCTKRSNGSKASMPENSQRLTQHSKAIIVIIILIIHWSNKRQQHQPCTSSPCHNLHSLSQGYPYTSQRLHGSCTETNRTFTF